MSPIRFATQQNPSPWVMGRLTPVPWSQAPQAPILPPSPRAQ